MNNDKSNLSLNFLDHVAIRVKDLDASAVWYQKVLRLKKYQLQAWRPFPVFLLSSKSGVALFPANADDAPFDPDGYTVELTTIVVDEKYFYQR